MAKLGRPLVMSVEQRRAEIFQIAEKLFGEKGFEQVTMSEIATAVGMSKKTLYVYFSDKRELLISLVESSYLWTEDAFERNHLNTVVALQDQLNKIAEHVLSERHIKLCRLAIAERVGVDGLTATFFEKGIAKSRDHLIQAVNEIDKSQYLLNLSPMILADMLFGATISKPFVDLLFLNQSIDLAQVKETIALSVEALFKTP